MIDLKFEVFDGMPCTTKTFEINGVRAFVADFCDCVRVPSDSGYCCECMCFELDYRKIITTTKKYNISESEFYAIGAFLTSVLDFSNGCDWCE